ncbi:hypothetical protein CU663_19630, partial [Pseudomonas syringae pv. actinidifoliorum]|nr:hypothetical protein [Pseudomonas syringae pv. actinidifoliorum]
MSQHAKVSSLRPAHRRLLAALSLSANAAQKDHFNVCWTIYAGWMPWEYAGSQGIVDKWAKKYGIKIDVTQLNDYVESIN